MRTVVLRFCYERTAEVGICHNRRDVGLTLTCNNQLRAGQDCLTLWGATAELTDHKGKLLANSDNVASPLRKVCNKS